MYLDIRNLYNKTWKRQTGARLLNLKKIVLTILGVVATIVGWGMWKEPHLDSNILASMVVGEVYRLAAEPFAGLGLMIMLLGLWMVFMLSGPWTLLRDGDQEISIRRKRDDSREAQKRG